MTTIIIDDNREFANRLNDTLDGDTECISCGISGASEQEIEEFIKARLDQAITEQEGRDIRVLLNRELRSSRRKRQTCAGESILANLAWRYDFPFLMYSFLPPRRDQINQTILLPSGAFCRLPSHGAQELLDLKISQCQEYIARAFPKMQHGFKDVSSAAVSVMRLVYGAVLAGRIRRADQFSRLDAMLMDFYTPKTAKTVDDFHAALTRLIALYERGAGRQLSANLMTPVDPSRSGSSHVLLVDDDAINTKGRSQWAEVLALMFEDYGISFSSILPSEIGSHASKQALSAASLILLDIDFSGDPQYGDDSQFGGLKLLEKFCQELPHIPVVMMSRYDEVSLYEECLRLGCYAYLTKDWGSYSRFRSDDSERTWFDEWERAITTPLRFKSFFQDAAMLGRRGVLHSEEIEGLIEALKGIKAPKRHTARSLASFFESFVAGYLLSQDEDPDERLHASVGKIEKKVAGRLLVGQILRVMRNNIVHGLAHIDEFDSWLFLTLQRVFILRCLKPELLKETSWTDALLDEFLQSLCRYDFNSDQCLFNRTAAETSEANRRFLVRRNESLSELIKRSSLDYDEFQAHIDAFIRCIVATFPEEFTTRKGISLEHIGEHKPDKLLGVITRRVRKGTRFLRGYEIFSSVWWVVECLHILRRFPRRIEDHERKILWFLASRCWNWYFGVLLGVPNDVLFFSVLEDRKLSRDEALKSPDELLIALFLNRNMKDYVPAYCLLIALEDISRFIKEEKNRVNTSLTRSGLEEDQKQHDLEATLSEIEAKRTEIETKEAEKQDEEAKLDRIASGIEKGFDKSFGQAFGKKLDVIAEKNKAIEPLKECLERLENRYALLKTEIDQISTSRNNLKELLQVVPDEPENPLTMDEVEVLRTRVEAKVVVLRRLKVTFDFDTWLGNMSVVANHDEGKSAIDELRRVLSNPTPYQR